MIKILHAADLHLDASFSGLTPEQAAAFRGEQRALLRIIPEVCRQRHCDLVFLAGDLFNGKQVYRNTLDSLCAALKDCEVPVFIAPGNHDPLTADSPYRTAGFPENVHLFTSQRMEAVTCETLGCRVYGAAFTQEHAPSLLEGFHAEDDGLLNLAVLHGEAGVPNSNYNPVTQAQLEQSGLRYAALGHIHTRGRIDAGNTVCAWPGCMMGHGFDETGEKGFYIVSVSKRNCETEFVPSGARCYEWLRVPAGEDAEAALRAALAGLPGNSIVRAELTGEAPEPDVPALHRALDGLVFSLDLRDRTVPPVDLWGGMGEDTLKGAFLTRMKAQYDAAGEEEKRKIVFGVRTVLALMDGREVTL